ncbi:MAG TPA: hypothetical protein VMU09_07035 [Acidimicrobiales bacterium]|nr:hypothetical protein [Acidimicrobiales bacterium]
MFGGTGGAGHPASTKGVAGTGGVVVVGEVEAGREVAEDGAWA